MQAMRCSRGGQPDTFHFLGNATVLFLAHCTRLRCSSPTCQLKPIPSLRLVAYLDAVVFVRLLFVLPSTTHRQRRAASQRWHAPTFHVLSARVHRTASRDSYVEGYIKSLMKKKEKKHRSKKQGYLCQPRRHFVSVPPSFRFDAEPTKEKKNGNSALLLNIRYAKAGHRIP